MKEEAYSVFFVYNIFCTALFAYHRRISILILRNVTIHEYFIIDKSNSPISTSKSVHNDSCCGDCLVPEYRVGKRFVNILVYKMYPLPLDFTLEFIIFLLNIFEQLAFFDLFNVRQISLILLLYSSAVKLCVQYQLYCTLYT